MQNHKTDTRMEDVPQTVETVQENNGELLQEDGSVWGSNQYGQGMVASGECQEETGCIHPDQHLDPQCFTVTEVPDKQTEKVRYRYDRRIGGWRRTY